MNKIITVLLALPLLLFTSMRKSSEHQHPVRVIFDTDIGPDYDDVGAITLLHAFADEGKAKILATVASNKYPRVAAVIDVFNTYFKQPDIPIGVPKGKAVDMADWQHWSDTIIAKYPHTITSNNEVPDPVQVYRKVLSQQPDHSVTIVTVGFLTNLANLLDSKPDSFSSLNGYQLIKQKVKKLVSMAGAYPSGREFNIYNDAAAAKKVFTEWPTPVIFSGAEIGSKIKTGLPLIHDNSIHNDPVKDVFSISIPKAKEDSLGRMSWDETAVLTAINGPLPYFSLQPGKITVDESGNDKWNYHQHGQYYLVFKSSIATVQKVINDMLLHQPK
jgi:inosine-uridine nucleoside N-ribohydrolase